MIYKTPLYINGELKGECLTVKLTQDQDGFDTRYAYHVEEFVKLNEKEVDEDDIIEILNDFVQAWCSDDLSAANEIAFAHKIIDLLT